MRILWFIILILLSCSEKGNRHKAEITHLVEMAQNVRLPNEQRLKYSTEALKLIPQHFGDSQIRAKLIILGDNLCNLGSLPQLRLVSRFLLEEGKRKRDSYLQGYSYLLLGTYYNKKIVNDSAFYFYLKSEKKLKQSKEYFALANVYLNKSTVQIRVLDFYGAEKSAIESLRFSKKVGDRLGEYDALINLAISSNSSEDYIKSNTFLNRALTLTGVDYSSRNYFLKEIVLNNMGNNYLLMKDYQKARLLFLKALQNKEIYRGNPKLFATILDNLAYCEFKYDKNNGKSLRLFLKSLKIKDSLNLSSKIIYTKIRLSEYFLSKNEFDESLRYAMESLSLARKTGQVDDLLPTLKQMSIVDYSNFRLYANEYIALVDSIFKRNRIARNKFAAIAYETEQIASEKEKAIKQKWVFIWVAVLLFIIGVLVVLLLVQRNKQKELRFREAQQQSNEEIYQLIHNQQGKIDEARRKEKLRIGRDLHDGIMNKLAATRLNLFNLIKNPSEDNRQKTENLVNGIQDIEKEIREISHDLEKSVFDEKSSILSAIRDFIEQQQQISSCKYYDEIDDKIDWGLLTGTQKINLFRILQEAVANAEKHANAQNIIITIRQKTNMLSMEIFDDGKGFSLKQKKKGIGLQNIYSRAQQCQGSLEINSLKGTGTTIRIKIPLNPKL